MKILITGGAGFIGSNFIHYWINKYPKDEIVNLDKLTYAGNLENLKTIENFLNYKFIQGDIANEKLLEKIFEKENFDLIVHFAAESHVDRSISNPGIFLKTNVLGTHNLLRMALKNKTRFHHVSTDEVFGSLKKSDPAFNEKTPYDPRSPYSASKAASDHLVRAYFHTYKLPVTISNCSNNYGPFHFPEKLFPLFITNLLENKKIPLYGDGGAVRDWLYVEDHCRAIDVIIKKGKIGETYCVGGNSEKSNKEVTFKILALLDKNEKMIEFVKDRPGHDQRYAIDFSKIKNKLGWEPLISFEDGLKKTIAWFRDNEIWWKNIKNGKYKEYYEKQYNNTI
jgi:dTDP-glucose 4,6-dehydratase